MRLKLVLGIVVLVIIAFIAVIIYFNWLSIVRDVVIVLFALIWALAGALVAGVAWYSFLFVRSMRSRAEALATPANELLGQAKETLGSASESARTAKEAIAFMSDKAVMPAITVVSAAVAARRFVEVLLNGAKHDGHEAAE